MLDKPESPKLTFANRRDSIYPYYAGFSEQFVESILRKVNASAGDLILDPWNGSGTTTAVCSRKGIPAVGVDLNPAMKPIAAVRSMSRELLREVCQHATVILKTAPVVQESISPFLFCGELFNVAKRTSDPALHDGLRFGFMIACRAIARQTRSKNPTWYSLNSLKSLSVTQPIICAELTSAFAALQAWKGDTLPLEQSVSPSLITADWAAFRWRRSASHVITSPPYLTRIDYVMKTLPELLFLSEEQSIDLRSLRHTMLGGVLTKSLPEKLSSLKNEVVFDVLEKIRGHESKASDTYYLRFFYQYFSRLRRSIINFTRNPSSPVTITIVTQGSYYKEIFVDLPMIVDEFLRANGFIKNSATTFLGSNNMVSVNSRSAASGFASPPETAATYERA